MGGGHLGMPGVYALQTQRMLKDGWVVVLKDGWVVGGAENGESESEMVRTGCIVRNYKHVTSCISHIKDNRPN